MLTSAHFQEVSSRYEGWHTKTPAGHTLWSCNRQYRNPQLIGIARIFSGGARFYWKSWQNFFSRRPSKRQKLTLAPPGGALGVLGSTYKFSKLQIFPVNYAYNFFLCTAGAGAPTAPPGYAYASACRAELATTSYISDWHAKLWEEKYCRAKPCRHSYTVMHRLKVMHCGTSNQRSSLWKMCVRQRVVRGCSGCRART